MTERDLYTVDDAGGVSPRGDYLKHFFTNRDGRKCLLYILASMGYFSSQLTDESRIVRNAAVAMLEDIKNRVGFDLDISFVR